LVEEDLAFQTLDAASARLCGVRRRAGDDSANVSGLPGIRNGRRLGLNRQPSGECRFEIACADAKSHTPGPGPARTL